MSFFVVGFGRASRKEGRVAMLNSDMNTSRLMVNVKQVKEVKLRTERSIGTRKLILEMSLRS